MTVVALEFEGRTLVLMARDEWDALERLREDGLVGRHETPDAVTSGGVIRVRGGAEAVEGPRS